MSKHALEKLVILDDKSTNPSRKPEELFSVYSLPAFDNDKLPEQKPGKDVASAKDLVQPNTILFNKLNVRFKRIWNLKDVPKNSVCSSEFLRVRPTNCHQDYLYHFLTSDAVTKKMILASGGTSSSHSRISPEDLLDIVVEFPSIADQQKIASVLSTLTDKIELNNKINDELEQMAKTLYDYWFVQFDFPDKNGKPYKSSGGKMVWSEELKREIPEGWEVKQLSDLIEVAKNGDWGKEIASQGSVKVYCIRGADINGLNGTSSFEPPIRYIQSSHSDRLLQADDLIIEISGGSPTQSTGRMAHISQQVLARLENNAVCSNFCKGMSLKDKKLSYIVNEHWKMLYESGIFFNFEGKTSGIKNLLFEQLTKDIKIALPNTKDLVNKYYHFAECINTQKQNNLSQNQKLSELRDWLLPMLMNGQLKIS